MLNPRRWVSKVKLHPEAKEAAVELRIFSFSSPFQSSSEKELGTFRFSDRRFLRRLEDTATVLQMLEDTAGHIGATDVSGMGPPCFDTSDLEQLLLSIRTLPDKRLKNPEKILKKSWKTLPDTLAPLICLVWGRPPPC